MMQNFFSYALSLSSLSSIVKSVFTTGKWFFRIALIFTMKIFYSIYYWSNNYFNIAFGTVANSINSSVKKIMLFFKKCVISKFMLFFKVSYPLRSISMITQFLCVCVCLKPSAAEASPTCNDFLGILECTDQRSCVLGILLDTSTKFLHLRFHHLQKRNTSKLTNWRENGMICAEIYDE